MEAQENKAGNGPGGSLEASGERDRTLLPLPAAMEEALYEIPVLRQFVGIDMGRNLIPDESTILWSRRLLKQNDPAEHGIQDAVVRRQ